MTASAYVSAVCNMDRRLLVYQLASTSRLAKPAPPSHIRVIPSALARCLASVCPPPPPVYLPVSCPTACFGWGWLMAAVHGVGVLFWGGYIIPRTCTWMILSWLVARCRYPFRYHLPDTGSG